MFAFPVTEQLHQAAGTFRLREMDAPQEIPPDHPYAGSSYEQSEIPILSEREREREMEGGRVYFSLAS